MSDIQAGDVVVCVDAMPRPYSNRELLIQGQYYRVTRTGIGPRSGRPAFMLVGLDPTCWFTADRFRKIEAPNTEIARRVRACKPIKTKEPANA